MRGGKQPRTTSSSAIESPGIPLDLAVMSYSEVSATSSSSSSVNLSFFEKLSSTASSEIPITTSSIPVPLEFFAKSFLEENDDSELEFKEQEFKEQEIEEMK